MGYKILIAEDEVSLSDMARNFLMKSGYTVYQAFDGLEAIRMAYNLQPDLILLDLMLPGAEGTEVLRAVRMERTVPVIVLSAKSREEDKLRLLEMGADDYMTKPYSFKEMVARVGAQLRRTYDMGAPAKEEGRRYGGLYISPERMEATANGKPLTLTAKEFRLLDVLSENANRVFTKQQIIDSVWGVNEYIDENTVAVTVARLREKLKKVGEDHIETVWGVGYKWRYSKD